ncbi:MAG: SH3 domain-containing protein [Spirochaetales bacterium]|nr:SH3 domain-containing protein [Spirochaetales bacterium]
MGKKRLILTGVFFSTVLSLFMACGPKSIGYGVVLWSTDEEILASGSLVPVLEESTLRDVYILKLEDDDELYEISRSRVSLFTKEKEARIFLEEYTPYSHLFGKNMKDGLAIRESADDASERVYKLREGQIVKITGRNDERRTVGDYEDYWYRVMTEDGFSGYAFGHHLDIFDSTKGTPDREIQSRNPNLEAFLTRIYRPEYYKTMIDENRIDLRRFTPDYGIFPNPEAKRIIITLPAKEYTIQYESIETTGTERYIFTGSNLQIIANKMNSVILTYTEGTETLNETFHYIEGIEDLRTAEEERRATLLLRFSELGLLQSGAYGTLLFREDGSFSWEDYDRLVPDIIPENAGNEGVLDFNRFPAKELTGLYEGVITFRFKGSSGEGLSFLYSITGEGLRLVYAPQADIRDGLVVRENPSPIVLFFSF